MVIGILHPVTQRPCLARNLTERVVGKRSGQQPAGLWFMGLSQLVAFVVVRVPDRPSGWVGNGSFVPVIIVRIDRAGPERINLFKEVAHLVVPEDGDVPFKIAYNLCFIGNIIRVS